MNEARDLPLPDATGADVPGRHHDQELVAEANGLRETLSVTAQAVSAGEMTSAGGVA
jgi:hypothetical protein